MRVFVLFFWLLISWESLSSQTVASTWRAKIPSADRLIQEEKFEPAQRLLEEIYPQAQAEKDCYWEGWSALWLGEAYYQLGKKEEAIQISLSGKDRVDACLHPDTVGYYSQLLQNLGVFYSSIGDYEKQNAFYELSFEQALKTHGSRSPQAADAYFSLGAAYGRRGYWDKCVAFTDTSLQISRAIQYTGGIASALHNLAFVYALKRDYQSAINHQEEALRLTTLNEELIKGYKNLGFWHFSMGDTAKAFKNYERSLDLCYEYYPLASDNTISILLDMANSHFVIGNLERAEALVLEAIGYLRRGGRKDLFLKQALTYQACILYQTHQPEQALEVIEEAMSFQTLDLTHESATYLTRGNIYREMGKIDQGIADVHDALRIVTPGFEGKNPFQDNPSIAQIQNYSETLEILKAKGELIYEKGVNQLGTDQYLKDALQVYCLADSLASRMRLLFQDTRSKESLLAGTLLLYNGAIKTCEKLYQRTHDPRYLDLAFQFSEKNKSQLVAESLNDLYARYFTGVPTELIQQERVLLSDIEFYTNVVQYGEAPDGQEDAIRNTLKTKKEELASIWSQLAQHYPQYYKMRQSLDIGNLDTVRQVVIGEKEVGIEYFLGEEYIYAFLIGKEVLDLVSWPRPPQLNEKVARFRKAILRQEDQYWRLGHELYNSLLQPIEDQIAGKDLCIITDGVLGFLPFETLLSEPVTLPLQNIRSQPFLIRDHDVRYLLSGQVGLLSELKGKDGIASPEILAMAPDFQNPSRSNFSEREGSVLPPLEGALTEVRQLRKRFKGRFFTGAEATKLAFLEHAPQYSVLHIATHTLIDDELPAFSRLIFNDQESQEDGQLKVHEIYGLTLNAELVILSACNTGIGVFQKGEGIYSLGRAFAFAGSPNLVMTLWPVKDKTTAAIMDLFYKNLEDGVDKSAAMNEAKRTYIANYSSSLLVHPYYWGGLLYSGNDEIVHLETRLRWWPLLGKGLLILLGVSAFLFLIFRIRSSQAILTHPSGSPRSLS